MKIATTLMLLLVGIACLPAAECHPKDPTYKPPDWPDAGPPDPPDIGAKKVAPAPSAKP